MKLKFNKLYLLLIVVVFVVLSFAGLYYLNSKIPVENNFYTFSGIIKTGEQLGELKNYCAEGLYLVSEENSYLINQIKTLQLRLPDTNSNTKMLSDKSLVGQKVKIVGKYPAQEIFCEALMCDCEDYILLKSADSVRSVN